MSSHSGFLQRLNGVLKKEEIDEYLSGAVKNVTNKSTTTVAVANCVYIPRTVSKG